MYVSLFAQELFREIEVSMSALSLSSFSFRSSQGATLASAQQVRGNTYGSFGNARTSNAAASHSSARVGSSTNSVTGRGSSAASSSAYCPTCGGNVSRSASTSSASYCPTCNRAGGTQSNVAAGRTTTTSATNHVHTFGQGGRVCVTCGYQGR